MDALDDPYVAAIQAAQDDLDEAVRAMNDAHARWLESLRAAHSGGWTLRQIGEMLGVSPQRVHQLING